MQDSYVLKKFEKKLQKLMFFVEIRFTYYLFVKSCQRR